MKNNEIVLDLPSIKSALKINITNPVRSKDRNLELRIIGNPRLGESRVIKEASFHAGTISKRAGKNALGFGLPPSPSHSLSLYLSLRFQATEFRSIGSAKEIGEIDESLKSNSSGIRLEVERIPRVTTVRDSEHI